MRSLTDQLNHLKQLLFSELIELVPLKQLLVPVWISGFIFNKELLFFSVFASKIFQLYSSGDIGCPQNYIIILINYCTKVKLFMQVFLKCCIT